VTVYGLEGRVRFLAGTGTFLLTATMSRSGLRLPSPLRSTHQGLFKDMNVSTFSRDEKLTIPLILEVHNSLNFPSAPSICVIAQCLSIGVNLSLTFAEGSKTY
jgi:hypothetical protein